LAKEGEMKDLRKRLDDYLIMRRGLGFKLKRAGVELAQFVSFMVEKREAFITASLALEWAQQSLPARHEPANRLTVVRGFAKYLSAFDPRNEVPADDLLRRRSHRARPYLYSDKEIQDLLDASLTRSNEEFNNRTYHCLFGLLAVSGMRVGEAIRLTVGDVHLGTGLLTINKTKFGKSRVIPLHPTTRHALRDYKQRRDGCLHGRQVDPFFISKHGTALFHTDIYRVFNMLSVRIGLRQEGASRGPRLHDFRHRFAVWTLLNWYRCGENVERLLPVLSTYLGHTRVTDTYWYLSACPELNELAVQRLEVRWGGKL
jgi:integrase